MLCSRIPKYLLLVAVSGWAIDFSTITLDCFKHHSINCFHFWVYPQRLVYIGLEDGPASGVRNVGQYKPDAGHTPKSGNS
jgi:hypothetical protein